jgi:hypothetical protein
MILAIKFRSFPFFGFLYVVVIHKRRDAVIFAKG